MKKFVVLSSISFLILAFGATVYGQEKAPALDFKASGFIDAIAEYNINVPQPGAGLSASGGTSTNSVVYGPPPAYLLPKAEGGDDQAFDKKKAYMESRGRLRFDALMGKEMQGTFQFEFDSTRWGERAPSGAQRNYSGHWGVADRSSLELKHLYFTFGVPWIPVQTTLTAGIQPFYVRPSIFMGTDGPGITASFKIDPATIKLMWAKPLEGRDWAADDDDMYGIEANAKVSTFTVGGYWVLFNENSYPHTVEPVPGFRSDVWWGGLYLDGKLGPVILNFDFCYDDGTIESRTQDAGRPKDVDLSGWGMILNVGFPWEKFLFGFSSIYGTGADQKKTAAIPLPGAVTPWGTTTTKVKAFIMPGGTEASNTHALIVDGAGINRGSLGFEPANDNHGRAGQGGLWINKIYGGFQVSPEFNTRLEVMYVRDTTKNGNTIGNALKTNGTPRNDGDLGWEIDWFNTLAIYKNLTWQFGGGILFAGDAMDYAVIGADPGTNKGPKNPWAIISNLTYSF
jgi:hypothetical protein